ncbi:MAG: right-handed parallel beta-helix repeat-containing protein [Clostridia bacterium]|nr:right-handed parallel beta-helix repeat-containing protein [Clostridia bacterium]
MLYYRDFCTTHDHAYNIACAIEACRKSGAHTLIFDEGTYDIYPDRASEAFYAITNHGVPGLKRICIHLRDLDGFTVDGNGAKFVIHGIMCPVVIDGCRNVTIKNISFDNPNPFILQGEIVNVGDEYVDWKHELGEYTFRDNDLYIKTTLDEERVAYNPLCYNHENYMIRENTSNFCFGVPFVEQRKELLPNGCIRIHDCQKMPQLHDRVVIMPGKRYAANIFVKDSFNTTVEDVTVFRGLGMGVVAQRSDTITLKKFCTQRKDGIYFSATADATHFTNCKGRITLEDCRFENQLDDGLNIHGIYTKIVGKTDNTLLLRYMHKDSFGIGIYTVGDTVAAVDPQSLIGDWQARITDIEPYNLEFVRLTVDSSTDGVIVGDVLENISTDADLTVKNCVMRGNKCRGMLIGTRGKVLVEGCNFHNAGCAVKFECDGEYWYESGPVRDVTIKNNTFDHCKDGGRDTAIITCSPRKKVEEGRYYHENIRITDNLFITNGEPVFTADNVDGVIFKNNRITNPTPYDISVDHCINAEVE